jgi:hypothetical protein
MNSHVVRFHRDALGHLGERKLKSLIALLQCACG